MNTSGVLNEPQLKHRFHRLLGICVLAYAIYVLVHYLGGHPRAVIIHVIGGITTACLWALGAVRPKLITLLSHLNLGVATLTLAAHAWNGALLNDSAWFLTLIPLFAAYLLGPRPAIAWMIAITGTLLLLPVLGNIFQPQAEWILSQKEVDRNRVMLVLFMSAFAVASAQATQQESERAERWGEKLEVTNQKLVQLNENLERSNLDFESMAAVLCHDLKSPLRGITGCLQILESSLPELKGDDRETFGHVLSSAGRMSELIDALNTYSKATTVSTTKTALSLDELLLEVETDIASELESRGGSILKDRDLGTVVGYAPLLRQLLQNLISNGLKFQAKANKPVVKLDRRPDGTFTIQDNGIGMSERQSKRIFLIYDRADRAGKFEGSGIGLAVCARVVALHAGKIWVESEADEGSTFFFTLGLD